MTLLKFRARKAPRHVRPGHAPLPAPVPVLEGHGDGMDVIEALEAQQQRDSGRIPAGPPWQGAALPGQPSYPYPLRWEKSSPGLLLDLADGLRTMDGPAEPSADYRASRAAVETVPFQTVPGQEAPAAPGPLPGLAADLTDLPVFREAVRRRTRCHAGQCQCGQQITGDTWGGRMVSAGTHLLGGAA